MSLTLFYLIGVAFLGWCAGPRLAITGTAFASGLIMAYNFTTVHPRYSIWILLWNETTRFLLIAAIGYWAAKAADFVRQLSGLVEERTAKLRLEAENHKATAANLAATVERFEQVINNITEVFWLSDVSRHQVIYVSPGYERIWGRKCEELYRDAASWIAAVHPDDREHMIQRSFTEQAGAAQEVECRIIRPDGAVRWIRDRAFPVRNQQGEVYRMAGIAEDITERKEAEEALRQSEEALRVFLDALPESALLLDRHGSILLSNKTLAGNLGLTCTELLGRCVFDLLPPQPAVKRKAMFEQVLATCQSVQFEDRRDDRVFISCVSPVLDLAGSVGRVAVFAFDVTNLKRVEEALRQSEQLQRLILSTAMDGYYALDFEADPRGAIVEVNEAYCRLTGYSREELLRMRMADLEAKESPEDITKHARRIQAARQDRFETRFRRKDGQERHVEISATWLVGSQDRVFGFVRDITQRKEAEEMLRQLTGTLETRVHERTAELQAVNSSLSESEARLRLALDASNAGTWSWDTANNASTWDDRYHALYGFEPHEPRSYEAWLCRVHPEDRERLTAKIQTLVEPGASDNWNEEFRVLHPVKGERWMGGLGRIERDQAGRARRFIGINLEITERKRIEQALRDSEAKYRRLHESMMDAFVSVEMGGRITECNRAYEALLGYTADELSRLTVP